MFVSIFLVISCSFGVMDDRLAVIAERQHGVLTRRQVLEGGGTQADIDRMLRRGDLVPVAAGTYRVVGAPRTPDQLVVAAVLSLDGPKHRAVVADESAAAWHGFHQARLPDRPTLSTPRGGTARSALARVRTVSDLVEEDVAVHATGVPITTPLRTVVDLALACRTTARLDRLLDRALLDRHVTVEELWTLFLRLARRGKRGTRRVRAALLVRSGAYVPAESELEHLAIEALESAGVPPPTRQHPLPGAERGRVDLAYPEASLLIELDGGTHRLPATMKADQRRDATAAMAGWQVLRFGWELVRFDAAWFAHTVDRVRRQRLKDLATG
jgi:very-short-patch-repair endonuclease/predicted transcriptional regulator of viral defense system